MEHIYSREVKKTYSAADPLQKSTFIKNVFMLVHLTFGLAWVLIAGTGAYIISMFSPNKLKNIENHVALVTGGANGLGRAICIELAKCGCHVAVADIDESSAKKTINDLKKLGVRARAYRVDVSNYDEVCNLRTNIEADIGPVDIVINNAGLLSTVSLLEGKPEYIQRVLNVNLASHLWINRAFLPGMNNRGGGHIVAISSILGIEASARAISYCATKFGVRGLMDALCEELRWTGSPVHVTTVFPGLITTRKEFVDKLFQSLSARFKIFESEGDTPLNVARHTIRGLRLNKRYVFMNRIQSVFLRNFPILPIVFQDTFRDFIKPRVSQEFMADIIQYE